MDSACPPGGGPGCPEHPESPPVARCVSCNRLLCSLCSVFVGERHYCRSCAAIAYGGAPQPPGGGPYAAPGHDYYYPAYGYPGVPVRYREQVFKGADWGPGEAFVIFFAALAASTAISLTIYQALLSFTTGNSARILLLFISSLILYSLMLSGVYYSVKTRHGRTLGTIGLRTSGAGRGVAWGFGLGIPLFIGALGLAFVSQFFYNAFYREVLNRQPPQQFMPKLSSSGTSSWLIFLFIFTLLVLAPICEEIFFRGYLYPSLRNRMGMQAAMILNGAIFAAVHFEIAGFLPRFLLGYGLCYLYERNRTLSAPVVGHALYNGLLVILSGVFGLF